MEKVFSRMELMNHICLFLDEEDRSNFYLAIRGYEPTNWSRWLHSTHVPVITIDRETGNLVDGGWYIRSSLKNRRDVH
jgi:hypothetical protein